ncbi:MAG: sigma-70 family RNA polymerase sigma factor [Prevotella sp.]
MGKRECFSAYYKSKYARFFKFANGFIDDVEVCKDIVNDVFEYLWTNYDSINQETVTSYLYKIIRNKCLDQLKMDGVKAEYINFVRSISESVETELSVEDYYDKLNKAMEKLTPYNRHILEECYLKKKRYKEVAEELNVTVAAIHKNISKALRIIRKETR